MRHASQRSLFALAVLTLLMPISANAAVITFTNPGSIIIPASGTSGPASPYPATILVAGITEDVIDIDVVLMGIDHTFPDDIDILLVGPTGLQLLLMSDAGGSADLVGVTYTFDDSAVSALLDVAFNATGSYRPSNFGIGDTFPGPAPIGPYDDPQLLSIFNFVNPNGTWQLFVFDDVSGDVGNISGWQIRVTTAETVPEPATLSLLGLGLVGAASRLRRRR